MSYNGWKNRATWNVILWIKNDEGLYRSAVRFMQTYTGSSPYRDFIAWLGLTSAKTSDGVQWLDKSLDHAELDEAMKEFAE